MVKKNFSLEHALKAQRYSGDNAKRASRASLRKIIILSMGRTLVAMIMSCLVRSNTGLGPSSLANEVPSDLSKVQNSEQLGSFAAPFPTFVAMEPRMRNSPDEEKYRLWRPNMSAIVWGRRRKRRPEFVRALFLMITSEVVENLSQLVLLNPRQSKRLTHVWARSSITVR